MARRRTRQLERSSESSLRMRNPIREEKPAVEGVGLGAVLLNRGIEQLLRLFRLTLDQVGAKSRQGEGARRRSRAQAFASGLVEHRRG